MVVSNHSSLSATRSAVRSSARCCRLSMPVLADGGPADVHRVPAASRTTPAGVRLVDVTLGRRLLHVTLAEISGEGDDGAIGEWHRTRLRLRLSERDRPTERSMSRNSTAAISPFRQPVSASTVSSARTRFALRLEDLACESIASICSSVAVGCGSSGTLTVRLRNGLSSRISSRMHQEKNARNAFSATGSAPGV